MAKENMVDATKKTTVESNPKSPSDKKVEVETDVAVKPTEEETDALKAEDVDELLTLLTEISTAGGLEGGISSVPDEMRPVTQLLINKLLLYREAIEDPYYEDVMDDMAEQAELGGKPDFVKAIGRTIPLIEIEEAADAEDDSATDGRLQSRISERADASGAEEQVLANWEQTMTNLDNYATAQNYSDEEKQALMAEIKTMMNWFADGTISEEEFAEIDKKRNYDRDINVLKDQVTPETTKDVMPDAASMKSMPVAPKEKRKAGIMDNVASINEAPYLKNNR